MKIIEERQFDYIPNKIFKNLSKRDRDNLRKYRSTYRWYKDNEDKLKSLENEIIRRKEKKNQYVKDLTKKNKELDHLRKDYQFSWSVSKLKNKGDYYNFTITKKIIPKSYERTNYKGDGEIIFSKVEEEVF